MKVSLREGYLDVVLLELSHDIAVQGRDGMPVLVRVRYPAPQPEVPGRITKGNKMNKRFGLLQDLRVFIRNLPQAPEHKVKV